MLSADQNFLVFRRFSYLQVRAILQRQDELRELEDQLDELDRACPQVNLQSREWDDRKVGQRRALLREIETTFSAYGTQATRPQRGLLDQLLTY